MALFGKKKKPEDVAAQSGAGSYPESQMPESPERPGGTPVQQIITMQQQGLSNNQIVQNLQQQGFYPQQIYDAMNQASIKGAVNPSPAEDMPGMQQSQGMPPPPQPSQQGYPGGQQMPPPPPGQSGSGSDMAGIEETVEAVVEEKWKDIERTISSLNEWKESADAKMQKFEQSMQDLKSDMDNLHKAIVSKIGEYDQNILNVGTEIKAMEKVFSKVLPTFTENVNELARVAKGLKGKPAKK